MGIGYKAVDQQQYTEKCILRKVMEFTVYCYILCCLHLQAEHGQPMLLFGWWSISWCGRYHTWEFLPKPIHVHILLIVWVKEIKNGLYGIIRYRQNELANFHGVLWYVRLPNHLYNSNKIPCTLLIYMCIWVCIVYCCQVFHTLVSTFHYVLGWLLNIQKVVPWSSMWDNIEKRILLCMWLGISYIFWDLRFD